MAARRKTKSKPAVSEAGIKPIGFCADCYERIGAKGTGELTEWGYERFIKLDLDGKPHECRKAEGIEGK